MTYWFFINLIVVDQLTFKVYPYHLQFEGLDIKVYKYLIIIKTKKCT